MTIGTTVQEPLYNADGGSGGGGGDAGSGSGGTAPVSGSGGSGTPSGPGQAPTYIDVSDDTLVRVKGSDKPVKFGEHVKGFQSQFTKASQEAARLKQQLQQEQQRRQEYERRVQQASGNGQPQVNQTDDILAKLEQLPYMDGKTGAQVVRGIGEQLKQRDMVMLAALQQMKSLKQIVDNLNGNHVNQAFEGKIAKWLDEGGYPKGLSNWAKELYLAYEGDDLDQEFPRILKERYEEINREMNAHRDAQARKAREARMFVPGKGGNAGPNSPLQLKGNESAKDLADKLWGQFGEAET